ncbi:hypothetical protein QYF36_024808 [Acer negundo]|nr:hypothetical protein QYF36_024808 [Acer negundo]
MLSPSSVTWACDPSGGNRVVERWVNFQWIGFSVVLYWPARSKLRVGPWAFFEEVSTAVVELQIYAIELQINATVLHSPDRHHRRAIDRWS